MSELYQGPVEQWAPDEEGSAQVAEMLASDDELTRAYGEAYAKRCYIREFGSGSDDPQAGLTAVGDLDALVELEFRHGTELDQNKFTLGDCVSLGALPGFGATRAERVLDGVRQIEEARADIKNPDELDLHGSFTENGYFVEAFYREPPLRN